MSDRTRVTLEFEAPTERAADLARGLRSMLESQGCNVFAASYTPPLPDYAPGISAEEAAERRITGPPLSQGRLA